MLRDEEIASRTGDARARHTDRDAGRQPASVQQAAEIALSMQRLRLRRYLGTLAAIGSTAPFIGLFGTVIGIMQAFYGMSQRGLSGELMAGGISEAPSATALGLIVAVPSVMAYNYFVGRVQAEPAPYPGPRRAAGPLSFPPDMLRDTRSKREMVEA